MRKTYTLGQEAETIIARQVAKGNFATPEEVVQAGLELLEEQDAKLAELRRLVDEGDAAYARGEYSTYDSAEQVLADIRSGEPLLPQQS
jgi:antitoxin ParD1/3/4